ncbi:MAG: hypothetical protein G8345_10445 [Magnetococcales bacterium]|nr:hypothetical protein [Magnetococcales bacterium]NGZ27291.1 hypothetical protein [Magnetococcales bacterium]
MNTLLLHEIYEEAAKLPEADQKRLPERWQRDLLLRQPNNLRLVESSATVPADEPVASPMGESATQPPEEGKWARIASSPSDSSHQSS